MRFDNCRIAIVCAHPDDEVIGVGGHLHALADPILIHVTDGAPRDLRDAAAKGFRTREEYACARMRELRSALAIAGIGPERTRQLGVPDQEASCDLPGLARRIAAVLEECGSEVVMTHPYEGGHPDHDATAFAVHAAMRLLGSMQLMEFTSYHAGREGIVTGQFLPPPVERASGLQSRPSCRLALECNLTREARARKRRMLDCFVTQQETLRPFGVEVERFREAPRYDFRQPPHAGPLYYDLFPWGTKSPEWLEQSRAALETLGLEGTI